MEKSYEGISSGLEMEKSTKKRLPGQPGGPGQAALGAVTGKAMGIIGFPVSAHSKDPNYL